MAYNLFVHKDRKLALNLMLHGVYLDTMDSVLRRNLRLTLGVLLAKYQEHNPSIAVDLAMMEDMIEHGKCGFTDCVWACTYIGFERVSSKWAKELGLHCVITARFGKGDLRSLFELENHTVQFYF